MSRIGRKLADCRRWQSSLGAPSTMWRARDTFLGLLKTCAKLGVSFWDYLGARLKIPDAAAVPWLPDLIRQRAPT